VKLLIWDFDGTLGYRASDDNMGYGAGGAWTASLLEVVRRETPDMRVTPEDLRPYLQSGFPWQVPDVPHTHLDSADAWWDALEPVFVRAYEGVGLPGDRAQALAKLVRPTYLNPDRWWLFDDTLTHGLRETASPGLPHGSGSIPGRRPTLDDR
jgi:putative hydrolase of the HAD superfamily